MQMSKPDITNTVETLEALVDKHGLLHVLTGLEIMCGEKALHVETNWNDKSLVKHWKRQEKLIGNLARKIEKEQ
jgi:hypothetical protein